MLQLKHVSVEAAIMHISAITAATAAACGGRWSCTHNACHSLSQSIMQLTFGCSSAEGPKGMADAQGAQVADGAA